MRHDVYFDTLSDNCFYLVTFDAQYVSKFTCKTHYLTFKNYLYRKGLVSFSNELCKGLSFYGDVKVTAVVDGSPVYQVKTNNVTVPYIGYRFKSDGSKQESYPHFQVNPYYDVQDPLSAEESLL